MTDFERPLNKRGRKAAPRVGAYIKDADLIPNLLLCSTATRAKETCKLVRDAIGADIKTEYLKSLYLAPPSQFLRAIRHTPDDVDRLMIISHNPGIHELAFRLEGEVGDERTRTLSNELRIKFPTAALAILGFEIGSWANVSYGHARLIDFIRPRQLR